VPGLPLRADGQLLAPDGATPRDDGLSVGGLHTGPKTVRLRAAAVVRLKSSFGHDNPGCLLRLAARWGALLQSSIIQQVEAWFGCRSFFRPLFLGGTAALAAARSGLLSSSQKSWSAPLPDKPSDRGLFGFPEDTGAAPITGAPAAHC
jgi:hypothetical protein